MFDKTPIRTDHTNRSPRNQTTRNLILRCVQQQRAALEMGDAELAELFATVTAQLLDRHLGAVPR